MNIVVTLFIILSSICNSTIANAQLTLPKFLPSECGTQAVNSIAGATDARVTAVANAGVDYDLGFATVYIGIDFETGKASLWGYRVYSPQLDTAAWVIYLNFPLPCSQAPITQLPAGISNLEFTSSVPSNSIEGLPLVNALKANNDYKAFAAVYPDSMPLFSILAVSVANFFSFPAGTPYWQFTWMPADDTGLPFNCLVHALTGETICFGATPVSVMEQLSANTQIFPNPADGALTIELPSTLIGTNIEVEAATIDGQRIVIPTEGIQTSRYININSSHLANGLWNIKISDPVSKTYSISKNFIVQH